MNTVSFPGLGIGEMHLNSTAFELFGRSVAWYGVIITFGIIIAFAYVMYRSKFEGIKSDDIYDYAIFLIPSAIVGARLYYVLTSLEHYHSFYDVIAIWEGGIAIYGAIIGGAVAAVIVTRIKKHKLLKVFDMLSLGVLLGQIVGRWGNFMNIEAFGGMTRLPWRMSGEGVAHELRFMLAQNDIALSQADYAAVANGTLGVHPTFLYESLWNLVGFLVINSLYKKKKFDGQIFFMYIGWYGLGRAFIEGLRVDSLYVGSFRISQVLAAVTFVICTVCLIIGFKNAKKKPVSECGADEKTKDTAENADNNKEQTTSTANTEGENNGKDN